MIHKVFIYPFLFCFPYWLKQYILENISFSVNILTRGLSDISFLNTGELILRFEVKQVFHWFFSPLVIPTCSDISTVTYTANLDIDFLCIFVHLLFSYFLLYFFSVLCLYFYYYFNVNRMKKAHIKLIGALPLWNINFLTNSLV